MNRIIESFDFMGIICYTYDMENIKKNIADNLILLRKGRKLTQKELAKEFNYSDKAISRWEIGDSLPDIDVLIKLCEFYNVEFDWLLSKHEEAPQKTTSLRESVRIAIVLLFMVCCFTIATIIFVYSRMLYNINLWQSFVWALQLSLTICVLCSRKWWSSLVTSIFLSIDVWVLITCVFLFLLYLTNAWLLYLIGIPIQIIIILVYIIRKEKNR